MCSRWMSSETRCDVCDVCRNDAGHDQMYVNETNARTCINCSANNQCQYSGTTSTNHSGDAHQGCTGLIWHVTLEDQHGLDGQCATCVANIGLSYGGFIHVPLVVPGSVRYQVASMGITMVGSAQKLGSKALQRVVTHTVYDWVFSSYVLSLGRFLAHSAFTLNDGELRIHRLQLQRGLGDSFKVQTWDVFVAYYHPS